MEMVISADRAMEERFKALGLPIYLIRPLVAEINKWVTNSGPEWTVNRLKSLKTDLLRQKADLNPLTWVRKNRRGFWYGVWGALFRYASKSETCFVRCVNALMVYSQYRPTVPTQKHVRAFFSAVGSQAVSAPETLSHDLTANARAFLGQFRLGKTQPLLTYIGAPSVKSPIYGAPSVPQNESIELELEWCRSIEHRTFLSRHFPVYSPVLEGIDFTKKKDLFPNTFFQRLKFRSASLFKDSPGLRPHFLPEIRGGKVIPLTKDGGWKVRWIASPFRIHQLALKPLGEGLYDLLKTLPFDCTFKQEKGHAAIQQALQQEREVYSVDLTSATDYFPLSLQLPVLYALAPKEHVDLFAEISRCTWSSPYGDVRWTNGQPMGLYPSFASFALTHGLLLFTLGGRDASKFFVLGDDVVILDKDLYLKYLETLDLLKCPHNPSKSLTSSALAEFAGKLITRESVVPQYKWRTISDDSFIDLVRNFGQRFASLLTPRQKKVYHLIQSYLPPYGCNHSNGMAEPLEKVVLKTENFVSQLPEKAPRHYATSFLSFLLQVVKPWKKGSLYDALDTYWASQQSQSLDVRVTEAFNSSVLKHPAFHKDALTDVLEVSGYVDLPSLESTSWASRKTTLQWYEEILGL